MTIYRRRKTGARRGVSLLGAPLLAGLFALTSLSAPAHAQGIQDADGDGVYDQYDNCVLVPNGPNDGSNQIDTDGDGFGNPCDADFDNNNGVDGGDFGLFVANFNSTSALHDLTGDGQVDGADFGRFVQLFNAVPGPSGLDCADPTGGLGQEGGECRFSQEEHVIPGRYIVKLAKPAQTDENNPVAIDVDGIAAEVLAPFGAQPDRVFRRVLGGFSVQLTPSQAEALAAQPEVESVSAVHRVHANGTQSSPPWGLDRIDDLSSTRDGSFEYGSTGRGVHVYVIDSGIRTSHDEFERRAVNNVDFVGDGLWECNGHGTHVASIIGGETYGVAKKAKLHNVRVLDCVGDGSDEDVIAALEWVAGNHVAPAIVNMSLGWNSYVTLPVVTDAVEDLIDHGVTVVAAAGNDGLDSCRLPISDAEGVIVVSATDTTDTRSFFTGTGRRANYGACVDLFAPGSSITGAGISSDTDTAVMWGTSQAAPHAAGAAALYLSRHPVALPAEVETWMIGRATTGGLSTIGSGSPNRLLYSPEGESKGDAIAVGDIDGDGEDEFILGTPGANDGGAFGSGEIRITDLYGGGGGTPWAFGSTILAQDSTGVWGSSEDGDALGAALAIADFDGDGIDDVAVSMIGDSINGHDSAGAVNVFYGSTSGLSVTDEDRLHQDLDWMQDEANNADWFGAALAAGDFNSDGYTDLVIGIPGEDDGGRDHSGAVAIVYGSSTGMSEVDQLFAQSNGGISGAAEAGDLFGAALATGDFDCDQYDDLAIGVPGEAIGSTDNAGRVVVLYGTSGGLLATGSQGWNQDTSGVSGGVEAGDFFGAALAAGDFDRDGCDDLAIGVPGENLGTTDIDAGMVNVLYGRSSGLSTSGERVFHQDSSGIGGGAESWDLFGAALAVGDFDADGRDDLAVGVPNESVGSTAGAGLINVIYGSSSGLSSTGDQTLYENAPGITETSEAGDRLGDALATGDLDGDGFDELIAGVPGEDDSTTGDDEGHSHGFHGSSSGIGTEDWAI